MQLIKRLWAEKPLALILFLAVFVRLLSVVFSKGFGMHDDHFLIIEASKSWVEGHDYNNWLPQKGVEGQHASGHSFFYVGIHYFIFMFLKFVNILDPQNQMYIIRLLHAIASLTIVYCGFKITHKLAGEKQAKVVGLLLATFWFMPFLSVRNLVEVVCVIPMMLATWHVVKNEGRKNIMTYVVAGVLLGLAFSVRFQSILFAGGFGLALLFLKQIKEGIVFGIAFFIVAVGIQGGIDMLIWGKPFVEFTEYVTYNIDNATSYSTQPWYLYLIFISGIVIPPISIFLLFGYFRSWKKHLLLFLPSFIFLAFHSYFPNKQERFIFPVIPFIIMLGYMGWTDFVANSTYWAKHSKLLHRFWVFFWTLNLIALPIFSCAYSKQNRVEAMVYLSKKKNNDFIAIEDSNREGFLMPPLFYLGKWNHVYGITSVEPAAVFYDRYSKATIETRPHYVVFMQKKNIEKRVSDLKEYFPTLTYETTIEPSYIDKLLHWLNPVNKNQTTFIYKL